MKTNGLGTRATCCFAGRNLRLALLVVSLALALRPVLLQAQQAGFAVATNAPKAILPGAALSPDEALQKLMAGNQRYVQDAPTRPAPSAPKRAQVAFSQHPFAAVLGCSDSRVPPEIIFDQGLGDLFVVRVAGNVLDENGLGSLEYAVENLYCPLIIVLGHSKCGAVTAAVDGKRLPGHVQEILEALKPAVRAGRSLPGDPVENAMKANVERVTSQLKTSKPILAEHVKNGRLKIVGARYDLATGAVELFP
jgi:carbonic anhydrase